jgi:hypothetical protein
MDPVDLLHQGCANSWRQFFFSQLFAECGNLLNVALPTPSILRWIIDFFENYYRMRSEGPKAVALNVWYSWT